MANKYFALVFSDLHLGEEDSIFMFLDPEKGINRDYIDALKSYLSSQINPSDLRYLILLGDAMDLSLAFRHQAFPAFKNFLEAFHEFLGEVLIYVSGNHDHHLWVAIQEEALIFQKIRNNRPPQPYYYALCPHLSSDNLHIPGKIIKTPYGKNTFLYHLLPESAQKEGKGFLVAYPNVYISTQNASLLTHGHFFEEVWTIFTDIFRSSLKEAGLTNVSIKKLEQINSPFIEFGWYSLGQAGELSKLLEKIWDELHTGKVGPLTDTVLDDLFSYLDEKISFKPSLKTKNFLAKIKNLLKGSLFEAGSDAALTLLREILEHYLIPLFTSEKEKKIGFSLRHTPKILSEEKTRKRIQQYLDISFPAFPECNTLIFGHTHVPFKNGKLDIETSAGKKEITCFNTGGWITDLYEPFHLSTSKPLVLAISEKDIKPIDIPWPGYEEFEDLIEKFEGKPEKEKKEAVKNLIWKKLLKD